MFEAISVGRRVKSRIALTIIGLALTLALIPLAWILWTLIKNGAGAIDLAFFTQEAPGSPALRGGGVANGIIGTLMMLGLAIAMAVPVATLGAIYLVEFGSGTRIASVIRFFADVMTGLPSIVVGIAAYALIVRTTGSFSALSGAVALATIMWPIVLRAEEEVLKQVPTEVREASYALGIPRARTVISVVLPSAASGLVTAVMLGSARAAGETAPLLFTALGNQFISADMSKPMSALPLEILRGATTAFAAAQERAWAAALTLVALILLLTSIARFVSSRRFGVH